MTSTPPRPCATAPISAPITCSSPARPRIGGIRTRPEALAALTPTAAHRREVGGWKISVLCRPQFSLPLALAVSIGLVHGAPANELVSIWPGRAAWAIIAARYGPL